jgi:hypothetical protein
LYGLLKDDKLKKKDTQEFFPNTATSLIKKDENLKK